MHHDTLHRSLATELGTWLRTLRGWTHFGTFTFWPYAPHPETGLGPARLALTDVGPSEAATRRCWERYTRRVSRTAGLQIGWFVAFEPGCLLGRRHIHALLSDAAAVPPEQARRLWKVGRSEVEVYDVRRGAAYYLAKFAGQEFADWDVGGSLVKRAKRLS